MSYRSQYEQSLLENRPDIYKEFQKNGQLKKQLDSVGQSAQEMHARIVIGMLEKHPLPKDPAEHEGHKGWIENVAKEIVLHDLVLVRDKVTERAETEGYTD